MEANNRVLELQRATAAAEAEKQAQAEAAKAAAAAQVSECANVYTYWCTGTRGTGTDVLVLPVCLPRHFPPRTHGENRHVPYGIVARPTHRVPG